MWVTPLLGQKVTDHGSSSVATPSLVPEMTFINGHFSLDMSWLNLQHSGCSKTPKTTAWCRLMLDRLNQNRSADAPVLSRGALSFTICLGTDAWCATEKSFWVRSWNRSPIPVLSVCFGFGFWVSRFEDCLSPGSRVEWWFGSWPGPRLQATGLTMTEAHLKTSLLMVLSPEIQSKNIKKRSNKEQKRWKQIILVKRFHRHHDLKSRRWIFQASPGWWFLAGAFLKRCWQNLYSSLYRKVWWRLSGFERFMLCTNQTCTTFHGMFFRKNMDSFAVIGIHSWFMHNYCIRPRLVCHKMKCWFFMLLLKLLLLISATLHPPMLQLKGWIFEPKARIQKVGWFAFHAVPSTNLGRRRRKVLLTGWVDVYVLEIEFLIAQAGELSSWFISLDYDPFCEQRIRKIEDEKKKRKRKKKKKKNRKKNVEVWKKNVDIV